jgi:hypothetical protein
MELSSPDNGNDDFTARLRELPDGDYEIIEISELRQLRKQGRAAFRLLFEHAFRDAYNRGHVAEHERALWLEAFESDPEAVTEALNYRWAGVA